MTLDPPSPAQLADRQWCEFQYNPRMATPEAATLASRWPEWAHATRQQLPFRTVKYGVDEREVLDIFPASQPKGLLAFIHGGYWRMLHKDSFSWIADALVPAGYSVAVITYPLCPNVTVNDISECCRKALPVLRAEASETERQNLVISGHSAGGYLTAAMFATDWAARGLPKRPFKAGISFSGVFELPALVNTTINDLVRLSPEQARDWSLHRSACRVRAPLTLIYGAHEPREFHRQSEQQAAQWASNCSGAISVEQCNHFNIIEHLRDANSQVFGLTLGALKTIC